MWWLFACCGRRRPPPEPGLGFGYGIPHERTPLIAEDPQGPSAARALDHQKTKERLEGIVRAKKGNMVNVTAQLPFNLYNQVLHPHPHHPPGSSRSVSDPSSSASYPAASRSASRSTQGGAEDDDERAKPILNVRLVHSLAGVQRGRRASSSRVRGRLGRFAEEREGARRSDEGEHEHEGESRAGEADASENAQGGDAGVDANADADDDADGEDLLTPRQPARAPQWVPVSDLDASPPAPAVANPALQQRLAQAGVISRSWGD